MHYVCIHSFSQNQQTLIGPAAMVMVPKWVSYLEIETFFGKWVSRSICFPNLSNRSNLLYFYPCVRLELFFYKIHGKFRFFLNIHGKFWKYLVNSFFCSQFQSIDLVAWLFYSAIRNT